MASEMGAVLVGALTGLLGGLGGVLLGHRFTSQREAKSRQLDGVKDVLAALGRSRSLGLFFTQQINLVKHGARDGSPDDVPELSVMVFAKDEWRTATNELQEKRWLFPCLAYMPEASRQFEELDRLMGYLMDPNCGDSPDEHGITRDNVVELFNESSWAIRDMAATRLYELSR